MAHRNLCAKDVADISRESADTNVHRVAVYRALGDAVGGVASGDVIAVAGVDADVTGPPHEIARLSLSS